MASLISLGRGGHLGWKTARDAAFILGLAVVFLVQLYEGINVSLHPGDSGSVDTVAVLVVICFLIGVARAWELIRGPQVGLVRVLSAAVREAGHDGG
jgi:hypothetical protein